MEQTRGETVVLSTGLKDKDGRRNTMMDPEDEVEEPEDEDDYDRFTDEDEDLIQEDEDEEIARFSFQELFSTGKSSIYDQIELDLLCQ